jgi:hypothetical protein
MAPPLRTTVPTEQGALCGRVLRPDGAAALPGVVLVDGSGCGGIEQWAAVAGVDQRVRGRGAGARQAGLRPLPR